MRQLLFGLLVWLAIPAAAQVNSNSYRLKARKCRAGYVRHVRRVKEHRHVWCVRKSPAHRKSPGEIPPFIPDTGWPSSTLLIVAHYVSASANPPNYFSVEGQVDSGTKLIGEPITVTIANLRTGQTLGSFVVAS
jgi:hypothetical protein